MKGQKFYFASIFQSNSEIPDSEVFRYDGNLMKRLPHQRNSFHYLS